jgi:hypothetical protein
MLSPMPAEVLEVRTLLSSAVTTAAQPSSITYSEGALLPSGVYQQVGATIRQVLSNGNDGANPGYRVGWNYQANPAMLGDFRAVLAFNLTDIPAGATITSVSLSMTTDDLNDSYPRVVELHEVASATPVVEGTRIISDSPPPADGVTWNSIRPGVSWDQAGGDFDATVLSTGTGYTASLQTVVFDSTAAFVAASQAALDGLRPLQLILKAPDSFESGGSRGDADFKSDDNAVAAFRPALTVSFIATDIATTTLLTSSTSTSSYGDQVTFAAAVVPQSSGVPSGTAILYEVTSTGDIISQIGTSTLDSGVATLSYSGFAAGTHYVAAKFTSTDSGFTDSPLSNPVQLDVNRKSVTGVIGAYNKVYDGTTAATLYSQTLPGVLAEDAGDVALAVGSASFADPNAGTEKTVTATGLMLTGSAAGNYVLSSTTATTTANITAKVLTATGSTQNSINISKAGTITFTITSVSGKVDGDTRTSYQLFNGSNFTLMIGSNIYSVVSTASVDQATGSIYVSWKMSAELYNDLVAVLGTDTSPSTKKLTDLIVSGYSSDGNYEITADCMANIFSSGNVVWS